MKRDTRKRHGCLAVLALIGGQMSLAAPVTAQNRVPDALNAAVSPRERISIDSDWRFRLGDPEGASASLLYDVRPEIKQSAEGRAADAEPEDAVRVAGPREGVLKPWILP